MTFAGNPGGSVGSTTEGLGYLIIAELFPLMN